MTQKKLKERWSTFINIILDPWVLILILGVITLILISSKTSGNESLKLLLTVLISIVSSVLGGLFVKRWSDINEEKIIVARGKSAIRSLKLLFQNIKMIENRVTKYIENLNTDKDDFELLKNQFEEVIEKCNMLGEENINSIEDWTDIIPEADITTQIGTLSELL